MSQQVNERTIDNLPACLIQGQRTNGENWSSSGLIARSSGRLIVITTGHSLINAATCSLSAIGSVSRSELVDVRLPVRPVAGLANNVWLASSASASWMPGNTFTDLVWAPLQPEQVGEWDFWDLDGACSEPAEYSKEGFSLLVPQILFESPWQASCHKISVEGTGAGSKVFEPGEAPRVDPEVYVIEQALDKGLSGSGAFRLIDGRLSFAGIVSEALVTQNDDRVVTAIIRPSSVTAAVRS
jgi:hypothetical protein